MKKSLLLVSLILSVGCAVSVHAQMRKGMEPPNLIKNGNFDDPQDPLNHWIYVFDHNKHYMKNHTYVSVVPDKVSTRKHVLQLDASIHEVCINQGVQVYTAPIRYNPNKSYKISLSARSIGVKGGPGPSCRIYPIAYRWHPKAVKSDTPAFLDLREDVRFQPIYFDNGGPNETGPFSHVQRQWTRAERVIPDPNRSQQQQHHLENCEWLMLKILAMDAIGVDKCNNGYLYISDVKIQEIGDANEVKVKAGSQTKSFTHGQNWGQSGTTSEAQKKLTPISGPHKVKKTSK